MLENTFGLLRWDFTPKPAFLALRNLLDASTADSAPVSNPGGLRYGLEGAGPDSASCCSARPAATRSGAMAGGERVGPLRPRDLDPGLDSVDVTMGEPISLARRFDPVESAGRASALDRAATDPSCPRRRPGGPAPTK